MLRWTDTQDIAESLLEAHPQQDPKIIRFTDLRAKIMDIPEFNDQPDHCNERVLEAVQMAWINLLDD